MRRLFLTYVLALLASVSMAQVAEAGDASAQADGSGAVEVLPDSSNFVTASILISSPGKELFFALGHCGLRLQCPSKGLDYCFSFSTIVPPGPEFNLLLLSGKMKAGYEALPYDEYLDTFRKDGRGVVEYPLNLTLSEERELWRKMDNLMMKGPTMKFDFIFNNCTGPLFRSVNAIMEGEHFEYPDVYPLTLNTREKLHLMTVNSPWLEFITVIMVSDYAHRDMPLYAKMYPQVWAAVLPYGEIVGMDGTRRPGMSGEPVELLPKTFFDKPAAVTPVMAFGVLLLVAVVLAFVPVSKVSKAVDTVLFCIHVLFSLYLLYVACQQLYGLFWNWFLIVFNPIPLLWWICCRKKAYYRKGFLFFAVVIAGFMLFWSLYTGRMEWAHELMLAIFLVRCLAYGVHGQRQEASYATE